MSSIGNISILLIVILLSFCTPTPPNEMIINQNKNQLEILKNSVRDVGYFLRNHKFYEYDRRNKDENRTLFAEFPRPALLQLHPQVKQFCGDGKFRVCLQYLHGVSQTTSLQRSEDTSTLIIEGKWTSTRDDKQIEAAETNCRRLLKQNDDFLDPTSVFQGPIERYQWRTSASYFMCLFTMRRRPLLSHFGEACDNFASCLDPKYGARNGDPRANDTVPFNCAMYSFCPDACCGIKHVSNISECFTSPLNPCHAAQHSTLQLDYSGTQTSVLDVSTTEFSVEEIESLSHINMNDRNKRRVSPPYTAAPECALIPEQNLDLRSLMLNHWNLSCPCPDKGYEWDSKFNSCVDIDECSRGGDLADAATIPCGGPLVSSCFNLPGAAGCVCKFGFTNKTGTCEHDHDFYHYLNTFLN